MCLTCKTGAYNQVLHELLKLGVPSLDMFLLFGSVDIIVQFRGLKNLDEFKEKWFNPIRMIGSEEGLITRTMTLIVIKSYAREGAIPPFVFLFLNTWPRNLDKVQAALMKIPEVICADTVFGPYSVICWVKAYDRADLERILSQFRENIPEIENTIIAGAVMLRL